MMKPLTLEGPSMRPASGGPATVRWSCCCTAGAPTARI